MSATGVLPAWPILEAASLRVLDGPRSEYLNVQGREFVPLPPASVAEIAELLGLSRRHVLRLRAGQPLNWTMADRLAVRLGMHPGELWPEFAGMGV